MHPRLTARRCRRLGRLGPQGPTITETGLACGNTPHVEVPEQRRRDPAVVTPLEGGPATTVRDSGEYR